MPTPPDFNSLLYLILALIGYQGMLWILLALITLPIFWLIKIRWLYFLLASCLIFCVNLVYAVNMQVYQSYKIYLEKDFFQYITIKGIDFLNSYLLSVPSLLLLLAMALIIAMILIYLALFYLNYFSNHYRKYYMRLNISLAILIIISFTTAQVVHAVADLKQNNRITFLSRHIPYYYPLTIKTLYERFYGAIDRKDKDFKRDNFVDQTISYPPQISCSTQKSIRKNIFLILVDSLRFDMLTPEIMPHTYAYMKKIKHTQVFANHLSGGNTTSTGLFSLFYSLPGSYYANFVKSQVAPLLFKALKQLDYKIQISLSANLNGSKVMRTIFRDVSEDIRFDKEYRPAWQADKLVTKEFSTFLTQAKKKGKPLFGFLLYNSLHDYSLPHDQKLLYDNYLTSINYLTATQSGKAPLFFNTYKNTVHFVDQLLGKLLSEMERLDLFKHSIIIISSDHGEEFDDNQKGYWGHNGNFSQAQLRVPLIVFDADLEPKVHRRWTAHFDILPYLFTHYLNCDAFAQYVYGVDLLQNKERETPLIFASYSQTAFRDGPYTYVFYPHRAYEVFGHDDKYRRIFDQPLPSKAYQQVLLEISKYYR